MKNCKNSSHCCYGHCFKENTCAYDENMNNESMCPLYAENAEIIIDEISKRSDNNEN